MQPEMKTKWIEALRSGNYLQSTNSLRNEKGFCCLGVLCDLVDSSGWSLHPKYGEYWFAYEQLFGMYGGTKEYVEVGSLPTALREELGIENEQESELVDMNDNGTDFQEIADWIEKNL